MTILGAASRQPKAACPFPLLAGHKKGGAARRGARSLPRSGSKRGQPWGVSKERREYSAAPVLNREAAVRGGPRALMFCRLCGYNAQGRQQVGARWMTLSKSRRRFCCSAFMRINSSPYVCPVAHRTAASSTFIRVSS